MSDQPTKPDRLRVLVTRIHVLVAEAVRCLNDDKLFRVRAKLDAIEGYAIELDVALLDATQPAPPDAFRYVLSRAGVDPDCPACGNELHCPSCSRAESAPQDYECPTCGARASDVLAGAGHEETP